MKAVLAFLLLTLTIASADPAERESCENDCLLGCSVGEICAMDYRGCLVCSFLGLDPLIIQKRQDCFPVLCEMYCFNGWATDSVTGCEICSCA